MKKLTYFLNAPPTNALENTLMECKWHGQTISRRRKQVSISSVLELETLRHLILEALTHRRQLHIET